MVKNIRHTGIVVSDLDKALHFYGELLGFQAKNRILESGSCIDSVLGLKDVKVATIKMNAPDGNLIELLYYISHPRKPRSENRESCEIGVSHIALTVDDLDETYKKLTKAGIFFHSPPQLS